MVGIIQSEQRSRYNIIKLAVCGNSDSQNGRCHQARRLFSRPHSQQSVIFFAFLAFIVFNLRPVCCMYEYACNELMRLAVVVGGRIGLCTQGVSTVGVTAGPARHNSRNVGVSLRSRYDTTLVMLMLNHTYE